MAKLILSMDNLVLKEIALAKERTTIGRKPHNDIQIDNLAVSGEHAVIVTILQDSFLEDLGSTNCTFPRVRTPTSRSISPSRSRRSSNPASKCPSSRVGLRAFSSPT